MDGDVFYSNKNRSQDIKEDSGNCCERFQRMKIDRSWGTFSSIWISRGYILVRRSTGTALNMSTLSCKAIAWVAAKSYR